MKAKILGLLVAGLLAVPMVANAALIKVDFTVNSSSWVINTQPYGMALSPNLSGTMLVDNTQTGASALIDFSLETGSKTWTESLFVGSTRAEFVFGGSGDLVRFGLEAFQDGTGYMFIYSNNSFSVVELAVATAFSAGCNECVSFTQSRVTVPEPGTLALLGLGLLGLGVTRRKAA